MLARCVALLSTAALLASPTHSQASHYQPSYDTPHGPELVLAYISSSNCVGNRAPGLHEAVDSLKLLLGSWARQHQMTFRAVGIALDWPTDSGLAYLKEFGQFDELVVGSNWFNLGAESLIWADSMAPPSIPQVLVYRHDIDLGEHRVTITTPQELKRVYGGDKIVEWARSGAPMP